MSQANTTPGAPPPLTGSALWLAAIVVGLGNFMVLLDTTIANVSIPHIAGGLAVSPTQGTWVITSYAVAEAITVPLTGWLAQRFGAVRLFITAMIGFGICSFACGFAPSFAMLVAFRVLQGLCGGPIMPMSQMLMVHIFPKNQSGRALGIWSMTTVLAPVAGPILGGNISDNLGWNWIFLINIPVVLLIVFNAARMLPRFETPIRRVPVDYVGLGLLIVWVASLQLMFDRGKELDWFASSLIVALAVVAAVGFVTFLIWELTAENPIVDLKIFRHRGFVSAALVVSVTFGTYFATIVLVPLWLQIGMGYTATMAGYTMAGTGAVAVMMSPVAARMMGKVDNRALVTFAVVGLSVMSFWRSQFNTDAAFWTIAMPQIIVGFFMPFFFIPNTALSMSSVLPSEVASAAGLSNFMRTLSGAFFTSLMTTLWENTATAKRTVLVSRLNDLPAYIQGLMARGMSMEQARAQVDHQVQTQSVMLATGNMFMLACASFLVAALVVWIAPKAQRRPPAGGGGH